MMLEFDAKGVRRLIEHAWKTKPAPLFDDLFDQSKWKEGAKPDTLGDMQMVESKDIDPAKLTKRLQLVKDSGIYLMNCSDEALPGDKGEPNYCVYAKGYGPDCGYIGGDDFAEGIELSNVCALFSRMPRARKLLVDMQSNCFRLTVEGPISA